MADTNGKPKIDLDEEMKDLERFLDEDAEPIAEPKEETDDDAVVALQTENEDLKDRLMRAMAEAENQRKRGERDRRDAEIYGGRKLGRDLLPVYDNMKRALEHATDEQRAANKGLFEGIELTQRELISVFAKHQIVPIVPEVGVKFNPEIHEAMYEAPVPGVDKGCVAQVMNEGFMIAEKLLRPAQVGVSSGSPT
ncbi:protein GrpE [Amylibacter ulvae]|uniref:Protein GrpE n=1 Tax=Paramylibacter ulvae TaxID=1651968 RepID=A0ABQ3CXA7_9RHOB|nr:nucleotide exchange factor GrpE [Amylibacter ulvae]GHA48342.1 protein GrpE [Amylibacter ulvae]